MRKVSWIASGVLAVIVLAAFFLPWVNHTGMLIEPTETGYGLAQTTESGASGMNLNVLYLTPLAALVILVLSIPALWRGLGFAAPVLRLVLVAVAAFPLLTTLPDEIETWTGGEVLYEYGLWITAWSLIGIATVALVEIGVRLQHQAATSPSGPVPHGA